MYWKGALIRNPVYYLILLLIIMKPGIAATEDENNLFNSNNMIATNTKKNEIDPNKGTGRIFQIGGTININSSIAFGSQTGSGYLQKQPYSFNSDLIIFMDSRINSHLRGYSSLLYNYSHADKTNHGALNEAFIDFDIANRVYFRIGKQRFKTGFGQKWRISDWLNNKTISILDTSYSDSLRTGITGLKVKTGFLTAFFKMPENADISTTQLYLQGEISIGNAYITISHVFERGRAPAHAIGISLGALGIDWYSEITLSGESRRKQIRLVDPVSRTTDPYANIIIYQEQKIRPLIIAGGSYNNQARNFGISFEYFYNGYGYNNANLYPYAFMAGAAEPSYLGKHYLAIAGNKSKIFNQLDSIQVTIAGNLNDSSFAIYPLWTTRINDNLYFSCSITYYFGKKNGEYTFPRFSGENGEPFTITNPLTMKVDYAADRDILIVNIRIQLSL